jgi:hypothetical protein
MADQSTQSKPEAQESRQQEHFDSSFFEQMSGGLGLPASTAGYEITQQVLDSYFTQADATLRQTRRIADVWAQQLILNQTRDQIVRYVAPVVKKAVLEEIKRSPELLRS